MRFSILVSLLATASLFAQRVPIPGDSETWLQKGVDAYRSGQFQNAIDAFQLAADFDPNDVTAHLYLATANMVLYVPGLASKKNVAYAEGARIEFKHALELDPGNMTALMSLGNLSLQQAGNTDNPDVDKLDEARSWYLRALDSDTGNKNALLSLAVIDWRKFYPALMAARTALAMKPEQPGPLLDAAVRNSLQTKYGKVIEEAISSLKKILDADPANTDSMSYLNLLVRERADLAASPAEYQKDIDEADMWIHKSQEARNAKTQPGGMTPSRIRVAPNVQAERLVTKVEPDYPPLARQAKIQGTVRFTAVISKDGNVENLQLVSGHPLLVAAAQQAVKQWTYRPASLNGQPVEVVTAVDVTFSLDQ
jgi:TonB family protein